MSLLNTEHVIGQRREDTAAPSSFTIAEEDPHLTLCVQQSPCLLCAFNISQVYSMHSPPLSEVIPNKHSFDIYSHATKRVFVCNNAIYVKNTCMELHGITFFFFCVCVVCL